MVTANESRYVEQAVARAIGEMTGHVKRKGGRLPVEGILLTSVPGQSATCKRLRQA